MRRQGEDTLLASRDFRLVAGSVGLSAFGDWVAIVALGLQVKELTGAGRRGRGAVDLPVRSFGGARRPRRPARRPGRDDAAARRGLGGWRRGRARRRFGRRLQPAGAAGADRPARRRLRDLPAGRVRARPRARGQRPRPGGQRPRGDRALHRLRSRPARRRDRLRRWRDRPRDGDRRADLRGGRDRGHQRSGSAARPPTTAPGPRRALARASRSCAPTGCSPSR